MSSDFDMKYLQFESEISNMLKVPRADAERKKHKNNKILVSI
jgi:hypothetical protein